MDKQQVKEMDERIIGPRLFCEYCSITRVFSPCYSCQYLPENRNKEYCRGCGNSRYGVCTKEYEICQISEKGRVLLEINKLRNKEEDRAHLDYLQISELPEEIGELAHLRSLSLRNNELHVLPQQIGLLIYLEILDLNDNCLSELPVEIGQLTNLQLLYLSNNQLSELPKEIKYLTKLQKLYIRNNCLDQLPIEIGQLTNLQYLGLGCNELSELPKEIRKLTNLQVLNLRGNEIDESTIQELEKALPHTEIIA